MTDRYAVIGNPISHSKSPLIHQMFAEQTGQDISYETIEAPLDGFAAKIEELRAKGYKGCNVTVPFKFDAFRFAFPIANPDDVTDAINTLSLGEKIGAANTDGIGLVRDVTHNFNFKISGKRILLMGAGGAAFGVLIPLLAEQPSELVIANRTLEKANKALEKAVQPLAQLPLPSISVSNYSDLSGKQFDLIINATSAGLTDSEIPLPPGVFAPGALAYDVMYGRETPFMKFSRQQGAQVADGLGMLVEQAAEAFYIWRGVRPETAPVIAKLRETA